ncbi:uncharacterized protein [Dermacentor andersoni]|uniref:uncharacterized protein n=1 Tax=Dermacentor andersoni TaxID=34620 RepID=UPI0024167B48|nr:uncharacterized protein LOC126540183 [Dermacentor andersoni]
MAKNKTLPGNAAEDLVGEVVQLEYDHTPLKQSCYLGADNSDAEPASPATRASVLMEEAQSRLVFAQHGDVTVASEGAPCKYPISRTAALFDLSAFVASNRRNDVSDILGKDDISVADASCILAHLSLLPVVQLVPTRAT